MQLQEAQELVRFACRLLLIAGGAVSVCLGILKQFRPLGGKRRVNAEILGFLAEHGGKEALSCPVVNLGGEGELRPVAVQCLKKRWRQLPGQTIAVCYDANDLSHVTPANLHGKKSLAAVQIIGGAAVMAAFAVRLLTA